MDQQPGGAPSGTTVAAHSTAAHRDDPLVASLWDFVAGVNRFRRRGERHLGLGDLEFSALRFLISRSEHGEETRQRDVGRHLGVGATTVSSIMDRLVRRGLATRTAHSQDRRSLHLAVTPQGREAMAGVLAPLQPSLRAALAHLSGAEAQSLSHTLRAFTAAMDHHPLAPAAPAAQH